MNSENTDAGRRKILTGALAAGAASISSWGLPALAQGESLVPFTDVPENFTVRPVAPGSNHFLDTREITNYFTPNDDFYIVQHYGQPEIDEDTYRLRVTGMVDNELEFSMQNYCARTLSNCR